MARCAYCGSSAQMRLVHSEVELKDRNVNVYRYYLCGCGSATKGHTYFRLREQDEIVKLIDRQEIHQKLFGRG